MSSLKPGEFFQGQARDMASDGRAVVVHPNGQTVFVAGLWLDETAEIKITGKKGRVAFGKVERLVNSSSARVDSSCDKQGIRQNQCGGCPWMMVSYAAQLEAKQARVTSYFARLGLADAIKPILGSPKTLGYRNRAQLKCDGQRLGFVANQTHHLVDVEHCPVLSERNNATLSTLREGLPNERWKPARRGQWTTLDIDESVDAESVSVNQRLPFQQANSAQNSRMHAWLAAHLGQLDKAQTVMELFCGSGNFTSVISAAGFREIIAVEAVEAALANLQQQALANVRPVAADLFDVTGFEKLMREHRDASVLVLDPPRDGLKTKAGLFDKKAQWRHAFYISCDLATLTRDVKDFIEAGFTVTEIQPIDQFPHTPHIELMVALGKA